MEDFVRQHAYIILNITKTIQSSLLITKILNLCATNVTIKSIQKKGKKALDSAPPSPFILIYQLLDWLGELFPIERNLKNFFGRWRRCRNLKLSAMALSTVNSAKNQQKISKSPHNKEHEKTRGV